MPSKKPTTERTWKEMAIALAIGIGVIDMGATNKLPYNKKFTKELLNAFKRKLSKEKNND